MLALALVTPLAANSRLMRSVGTPAVGGGILEVYIALGAIVNGCSLNSPVRHVSVSVAGQTGAPGG